MDIRQLDHVVRNFLDSRFDYGKVMGNHERMEHFKV